MTPKKARSRARPRARVRTGWATRAGGELASAPLHRLDQVGHRQHGPDVVFGQETGIGRSCLPQIAAPAGRTTTSHRGHNLWKQFRHPHHTHDRRAHRRRAAAADHRRLAGAEGRDDAGAAGVGAAAPGPPAPRADARAARARGHVRRAPDRARARRTRDAGVLFMHNEGFSTMCGHGIIAVVTIALERGLIATAAATARRSSRRARRPDSRARAAVAATAAAPRVERVSFVNVPSFVLASARAGDASAARTMPVDVAFGGAFYAIVDAEVRGHAGARPSACPSCATSAWRSSARSKRSSPSCIPTSRG